MVCSTSMSARARVPVPQPYPQCVWGIKSNPPEIALLRHFVPSKLSNGG